MTYRLRLPLLLLSIVVLLVVSCGGDDKPATKPGSQGDGRTSIPFVTKSGKKPVIYAEIAQTIPELNVGLSKRGSLPPEVGMLFILPFRGPGFWMKDTTIPLSVAFIAQCGEILTIADMQPLSEQLHQSEFDYKFGLEVNQGWFTRNSIAVGDKITLPANLKQPLCP